MSLGRRVCIGGLVVAAMALVSVGTASSVHAYSPQTVVVTVTAVCTSNATSAVCNATATVTRGDGTPVTGEPVTFTTSDPTGTWTAPAGCTGNRACHTSTDQSGKAAASVSTGCGQTIVITVSVPRFPGATGQAQATVPVCSGVKGSKQGPGLPSTSTVPPTSGGGHVGLGIGLGAGGLGLGLVSVGGLVALRRRRAEPLGA